MHMHHTAMGNVLPAKDAGHLPDPPGAAQAAAQDSTRERILAAAEGIFLEEGFDKATVRDICGRAKANVAAVNYHFRDKRSLYYEVMFGWANKIMARYPLDMGVEQGMTPEQRLEAFVHAELLRLLTSFDADPAKGLRRARLVMSELTCESPNKDLLAALHRPSKEYLGLILADLLGPDAPRTAMDQCANLVIGQCVHYLLSRLAGLDEDISLETEDDIRALTQRIAIFSLGGIRAVKETLP